MARFNQLDIDEFSAKAAWARNEAQAAKDERSKAEFLRVALAYETLAQDLIKEGFGDPSRSLN
jgi:hypothetical protein